MTDADRTSAQPEEQEEQGQTNGGLLSKLVETAKSVVSTVTETAKDVAGSVTDHTSTAESPAATVETAANDAADKVRDHDEPSEEASAVAQVESAAETTEVTEPVAVAETAGTETEVVADTAPVAEAAPDAEAVPAADAAPAAEAAEPQVEETSTVAAIATAVQQRIARVYDALVSTGTSADESAEATQESGATYQPGGEGGAKGGRPRRFKDIQPGMHLQGKVTSIALYGIFVDVGVGRDGLVHISEMSDKRIDTPTDLVEIGLPVEVWVKSVDPDARRISLTMRDPSRPKPERQERRAPRKREVDRDRLAEMKPGDTIEGVVSSLAPFGAFVDIGVGKDGLVHVSELAEGRVERPEDAVQVGERYTFKVLEVDPDGNRISLSLRRAMRTQRMQQLESGTVMDGTISGIAPFGAFVDIGVGRDGLVHVSEISPDRVTSVADAVKVGDKVQVKVIEVEPNSKRISLTMRVDEPLPNERAHPAPRASFGSTPGAEAPRYTPAPAYSSAPPSFSGPPPMEDNRGGDRRGGGRRGGRDFSRGGEGEDYGRGDARGGRRDHSERSSRSGGGRGEGRGRRDAQSYDQPAEVYSTSEDNDEEAFTGDATLEDLLSKFNAGKGKDRGKGRGRGEHEDEDDAGQNRAEVIRRTLALRDEE